MDLTTTEDSAGMRADQTNATGTQEAPHCDIQAEMPTQPLNIVDQEVEQEGLSHHDELDKECQDTYPANKVGGMNPQPPSAQFQMEPNHEGTRERPSSLDRDDGPNMDVGQALHQVLDHNGRSRVSKTRSKKSQRSTALSSVNGAVKSISSSEILDYLQIVQYKVHQKDKNDRTRFSAERDSLQTELQQTIEAKQVLHDRLEAVLQEKQNLVATIDKQKRKVDAYERNIDKYTTYVKGLGHDVDKLKREANSHHHERQNLKDSGEELKSELSSVSAQLRTCTEQSARLTTETLATLRESQAELRDANARGNYLEHQLNEKVGMLTDERDRRSQLQSQLDRQLELASATPTDQKVMEMLNANKQSILDKLFEISSTFLDGDNRAGLSNKLEETLAAVHALNSQAATTVSDIGSVKSIIAEFEKRYVQKLVLLMEMLTSGPVLWDTYVKSHLTVTKRRRPGSKPSLKTLCGHSKTKSVNEKSKFSKMQQIESMPKVSGRSLKIAMRGLRIRTRSLLTHASMRKDSKKKTQSCSPVSRHCRARLLETRTHKPS